MTRFTGFLTGMVFCGLALAADGVKPQSKQPPKSPAEALAAITLPAGFKATLFAGEPDIVQPIAICTDDRGRLWVAECTSYPKWSAKGNDKLIIFEDTNGDGKFDKRTVFYDKLGYVSGLVTTSDGVYVASLPNLYFFADKDHDDKPDGEPTVVLDGWDYGTQAHNQFNSLTFGPDGWLYGCNGISNTSKVGKPGTPEKERTLMSCGVWRYHPKKQVFERFAEGGTNPWGIDFDERGQLFWTNCVTPHLDHVIQGAHYKRMFGHDFSPHIYGQIQTIADHLHWAGGEWTTSRGGEGAHGLAGGGHAHAGAAIYLADEFGAENRGRVFMVNIHGARLNSDNLVRKGSGYVATHGPDFFMANDKWFRGVAVQYGPDGGMYVTDWYDNDECHTLHPDRANGRVYKIASDKAQPVTLDLSKMTDVELVALHTNRNEWYVRHARRVLQERPVNAAVHAALIRLFMNSETQESQLKAMWTLHVTGGASADLLRSQLDSPHEYIRAWAIQLLSEDRKVSDAVAAKFSELAEKDSSPVVRLYLASACQRVDPAIAWDVLDRLVRHAEDINDMNLPLMYYYAAEHLVPADRTRGIKLAQASKLPVVREFVTRLVASK